MPRRAASVSWRVLRSFGGRQPWTKSERQRRAMDILNRDGEIILRLDEKKYRGHSVDFSRMDLRGAVFDGLILEGAYFAQAALYNASFVKCDLYWADFFGAVAVKADFRGAELRGANLEDANLQ